MKELTFVQFTDVHVGKSSVFPDHVVNQVRQNLAIGIDEVNNLDPVPDFLIVTGDAVNSGSGDIKNYLKIISKTNIPVYHIPSSHDLAISGKSDGNIVLNDNTELWEKLVGPARISFQIKGVKFIFFEPFRKISEKRGMNIFDAEAEAWLSKELKDLKRNQPVVIGYHIPILPKGGGYIGWENAGSFLELIKKYNVLACISGHRHRNDENTLAGVTQIQTGPLAGFQWTGLAPHYMFPVRAGYRIFEFKNGRLHSFYKEIGIKKQVTLKKVNGIHTMGPRPMVRPVIIHSSVLFQAKAYSKDSKIKKVEYSLDNKKWEKLKQEYDGIWTEWEGRIPYEKLHKKFNIITVRATTADKGTVYDSVPVFAAETASRAGAGPEMVFELMTQSAECGTCFNEESPDFPWKPVGE